MYIMVSVFFHSIIRFTGHNMRRTLKLEIEFKFNCKVCFDYMYILKIFNLRC